MCQNPKIMYFPSKVEKGQVEFFKITTILVVERLNVPLVHRRKLTRAVSPHGHFNSLEQLLAPHAGSWDEITRGGKQKIGTAIDQFAIPNTKTGTPS